MMNTALFAQLTTAIMALDDTQGAQLLAIANGFAQLASAPAAPAPAPEPKVYEPATDVSLPITLVKGAGNGKKAFTLGYGAGRGGAKLMIKNAGFTWDASLADDTHKGAWVGTAAQYKALGVVDDMLPVPAEWVQAGRDKAAEKAAKKAQKG